MTNNIKPFVYPASMFKEEDTILGKPMRSDKKVLFCGRNFINEFDNIKNKFKHGKS